MRRLETRQTIGLGVAAGIVIVVAALVAVFGVVPFPTTPTVAEQPDPAVPGRLAYLVWDRDDTCLHVVDGVGTDTEVTCGLVEHGGGLRWTDDGYVAVRTWDGAGEAERIIDPATGVTVELRPVPAGDQPGATPPFDPDAGHSRIRADGWEVRTDSRSGRVTVSVGPPEGPREVVWEAAGPASYRLDEASWSPDGEWLLLRDSRGHLLVMGAEGDPAPRIWVEDAGWEHAWFIRGVAG